MMGILINFGPRMNNFSPTVFKNLHDLNIILNIYHIRKYSQNTFCIRCWAHRGLGSSHECAKCCFICAATIGQILEVLIIWMMESSIDVAHRTVYMSFFQVERGRERI
jgi:hypothetical protein